jgi:hypothetical protein
MWPYLVVSTNLIELFVEFSPLLERLKGETFRLCCLHENLMARVEPSTAFLVRLNQLRFSSKQQRQMKQLSKIKKTSKCEKSKVFD